MDRPVEEITPEAMQRLVECGYPGLVPLLLMLVWPATTVEALPRFASRTGGKCQSCHVNPSGGAMGQAFGVQYGRERLPVPEWSTDTELEDFSNIIAQSEAGIVVWSSDESEIENLQFRDVSLKIMNSVMNDCAGGNFDLRPVSDPKYSGS